MAVSFALTVAGDVATFDGEAYKVSLARALTDIATGDGLKVNATQISLNVSAASVHVVATVTVAVDDVSQGGQPTDDAEFAQQTLLQAAIDVAAQSTDDLAADLGVAVEAVDTPVALPVVFVPAPSPPPPTPSCTNIAAFGADYCYQIEGTTAENCGNYFKTVATSIWRYCEWDESRSKCRSKGGNKVNVEPACDEDEPTACMYAIAQGDWCQSVTDMALCPLSYAQFQYQGEVRYKGCAVRSGKCKGKGTAFGSTMPDTCEGAFEACSATLDTVEAAMMVCSEGGECDFSSFSSLTAVCDTDKIQAIAEAFKLLLETTV